MLKTNSRAARENLRRYITESAAEREESRQHWLKCHAENICSGRDDLIIFSAKILAAISLADDMLEKISV